MSQNTRLSTAAGIAPPPPNPWKIGFAAVRANIVPGMALWALGVLILVCYFCIEPTRAFFNWLEEYQNRQGPWFSIASYDFFSAVVPLVFCFSLKSLRPPRPWWKAVLFAFGLWTLMGCSVKVLYWGLEQLYGKVSYPFGFNDYVILIKKILTDQFVFSTFYGAPLVAISHFWRDRGYDFGAVRGVLRSKGWFKRMILPTLIMSWTIWIPALCVMYSLPMLLQSHIGGLVNGFWSLICLQIANKSR